MHGLTGGDWKRSADQGQRESCRGETPSRERHDLQSNRRHRASPRPSYLAEPLASPVIDLQPLAELCERCTIHTTATSANASAPVERKR
jgi:hypothetical protein